MRVSLLEVIASLVLGGFVLVSCQPAAQPTKAAPKKDSCSANKSSSGGDDDESSDEDDEGSDDEGSNLLADVTYDDDVKSIMTGNCTSCHSADADDAKKQTPYLTSASLVEKNISKIISEMRGGTMPPDGGSEDDADVLEAWEEGDFAAGGSSGGSSDGDGGKNGVFYANAIKDILADNCVSCHGKNGDSPNLSTYSAAKKAAEASLEAIQDDTMPKDGDPLSDSDKEAFAAWVNADMPEEGDEDGGSGSSNAGDKTSAEECD